MDRLKRYKKGLWAERVAVGLLRLKGYSILERRFQTGAGLGCSEIDIIARRGDVIVFVEVKSRRSVNEGLFAVTPTGRTRLRRAAEVWMARNGRGFNARFDVIVVSGWRVKHFKNYL
ncbi:MAG: YraN family protein [Alphaproteobacteria bacterium]|nr:YraN family protein [Alphaproteobacteria bacterium]